MVLYNDSNFLLQFEKSETHKYARESLSGASFTDVCVRRGCIEIKKRHPDPTGMKGVENDGMPKVMLVVESSVLIRYSAEVDAKGDWGVDRRWVPGEAFTRQNKTGSLKASL